MVKFTKKELKFLKSMEACRMGTAHSNIPHVKPVSYIFDSDHFYIAVDYDTRAYKNLEENPRISLSIDIYDPKKGHKAVVIQGKATIIEKGKEFGQIFKKFYKKFKWVQENPWEEGESPFLKITPLVKTSWGLEEPYH